MLARVVIKMFDSIAFSPWFRVLPTTTAYNVNPFYDYIYTLTLFYLYSVDNLFVQNIASCPHWLRKQLYSIQPNRTWCQSRSCAVIYSNQSGWTTSLPPLLIKWKYSHYNESLPRKWPARYWLRRHMNVRGKLSGDSENWIRSELVENCREESRENRFRFDWDR